MYVCLSELHVCERPQVLVPIQKTSHFLQLRFRLGFYIWCHLGDGCENRRICKCGQQYSVHTERFTSELKPLEVLQANKIQNIKQCV